MKRLLLTISSVVCLLSAFGQDIHFSQFNASPLTLNPALTGKLECTYRAAVNYRNQWNAIPAPFVTYSAAFDAALLKNKLNGSALGIGVLGFNDRSGDGNLTNTTLGLSLAYHQRIGEGSQLSAGFQGAFVNKNVDIANLIFPNQIGPGGPVIGAPNGENFQGGFNYVDLNAGMHWSTVADGFSFTLGGAVYHILEPNESFLGATDNNLPRRIVAHGSLSFELGDQFSLSPSGLYMVQAGSSQINAGTALGYHMDDASMYFGAWHRYAGTNPDAIVALLGLEFSSLLFGFSYDITISEASNANNGRGGFELSLSYNGCVEAKRKITSCPKF